MMGRRNTDAYLARQRKAGPHGGSRRPYELEEGWSEECPDCCGLGIDQENVDDGCCELCDGTGRLYD